MRSWSWCVLLLLPFLLSAVEAPVSVQVRPRLMATRGDIVVDVRVPRHPDNRMLAIAWTSDVGSEGGTLRQLDGEDAPILHTLRLPDQPAANYLFVVTVVNRLGQARGRADTTIRMPESR